MFGVSGLPNAAFPAAEATADPPAGAAALGAAVPLAGAAVPPQPASSVSDASAPAALSFQPRPFMLSPPAFGFGLLGRAPFHHAAHAAGRAVAAQLRLKQLVDVASFVRVLDLRAALLDVDVGLAL